MNSQTARLLVLTTALLALVSICMALLMALRLRTTRVDFEDLRLEDTCPGQAPLKELP